MAQNYSTRFFSSINDIEKAQWDSLAEAYGNPFLKWDFLALLEDSGSVCPESGWHPCHYALFREISGSPEPGSSELVAAAPLYIKTNSDAEFVWDYPWAEAAFTLKQAYYPKLVGMIPATPVPCWRPLFAKDSDKAFLSRRFLGDIRDLCAQSECASINLQYVDPEWLSEKPNSDYMKWERQCWLWDFEGLDTFEKYLSLFDKNQRRNIHRERTSIIDQGIELRMVEGEEAPESFYPLLWKYYLKTNEKFGIYAAQWLTEGFFAELKKRLPKSHVFSASFMKGSEEPIALSLLFKGRSALYGRYWGAREAHNNLHFEACYYSPIEYCLKNKIRYFDPGLGSEHKARRGFKPYLSASYHYFSSPIMQGLFKGNIDQFNQYAKDEVRELEASLPFKKTSSLNSL